MKAPFLFPPIFPRLKSKVRTRLTDDKEKKRHTSLLLKIEIEVTVPSSALTKRTTRSSPRSSAGDAEADSSVDVRSDDDDSVLLSENFLSLFNSKFVRRAKREKRQLSSMRLGEVRPNVKRSYLTKDKNVGTCAAYDQCERFNHWLLCTGICLKSNFYRGEVSSLYTNCSRKLLDIEI